MKRVTRILVLILLINLYPFGCEAQQRPDCTLESEQWEAEKKDFNLTITRLTGENQDKANEIAGLKIVEGNLNNQIDALEADNNSLTISVDNLEGTIVNLNNDIVALQADNTLLNTQLEECNNREVEVVESEYITVAGVEYKVSDIELIRPKTAVDTVTVTHCGATKETIWFHHGGLDIPYPKDITFATEEFGMTRVHFKDSLTDEIKVQTSYQLKRIKDYVNARTTFEFVK